MASYETYVPASAAVRRRQSLYRHCCSLSSQNVSNFSPGGRQTLPHQICRNPAQYLKRHNLLIMTCAQTYFTNLMCDALVIQEQAGRNRIGSERPEAPDNAHVVWESSAVTLCCSAAFDFLTSPCHTFKGKNRFLSAKRTPACHSLHQEAVLDSRWMPISSNYGSAGKAAYTASMSCYMPSAPAWRILPCS